MSELAQDIGKGSLILAGCKNPDNCEAVHRHTVSILDGFAATSTLLCAACRLQIEITVTSKPKPKKDVKEYLTAKKKGAIIY